MCQCPSTGFLHFYKKKFMNGISTALCVNALQRASFISTTLFNRRSRICIRLCQCPSTGFLHFYPDIVIELFVEDEVCQCPSTGFLHFYMKIEMSTQNSTAVCQCPSTGFLHFYRTIIIRRGQSYICVNALQRASFISTYLCDF